MLSIIGALFVSLCFFSFQSSDLLRRDRSREKSKRWSKSIKKVERENDRFGKNREEQNKKNEEEDVRKIKQRYREENKKE